MKQYIYGNPDDANILIQMVDDHDLALIESEILHIRELTDRDFCLVAVKVNSWNKDLSPWKAKAVFGNEDFGDGAEHTLQEILKITDDPEKTYFIGGYSLAGLFALWAAFQTNIFSGVAAVSPSIWFPGFTDYMKERKPGTESIYLSLGDKEAKTKNPIMASVGDRICVAHDDLQGKGVECILEWNKGNHFIEPDMRMAKGFAWVLNEGG